MRPLQIESDDHDEEMEEMKDTESMQTDPYAALSPRSRRKRKNRDQMRAARQRERETMERLRTMVERLEVQYQALQAAKEQQQNTTGSGSMSPSINSTTEISGTSQMTTLGGVTYAELISLKSQFQEENFQLKQVLYEKGKLKQTLERYVNDVAPPTPEELRVLQEDLACDAPLQRPLPAASTDDLFPDYVAQSADAVWRLIADARRRIAGIQQTIQHQSLPYLSGQSHATITILSPSSIHSEDDSMSSSSSPPSPPPTPPAPLPSFCGWDLHHHIESHELLFEFVKSFPHITPYAAMMRMWTNELAMNTYRNPHEAESEYQTLRIVQHISDNAYVLQRRLVDPATLRVVVSTYVRFHTRTPQGFLVGLVSIDQDRPKVKTETPPSPNIKTEPWPPQPRENELPHFYSTRVCVHTEFLPVAGQAGCTVRMVGSTGMDNPATAQRTVADLIMKLLRWENVNIGPFFALTDR